MVQCRHTKKRNYLFTGRCGISEQWPACSSGGWGGGEGDLCHHVFLALIESHLTHGHGPNRHIDGGRDEAVDADLGVESVDGPWRVLAVEKQVRRKTVREQKNFEPKIFDCNLPDTNG